MKVTAKFLVLLFLTLGCQGSSIKHKVRSQVFVPRDVDGMIKRIIDNRQNIDLMEAGIAESGRQTGDFSVPNDVSSPVDDVSSPVADGSSPGADGSSPGADGSSPGADGSSPGADGSSPGADGSSPGADGSSPGADGSSPAAQSTPIDEGLSAITITELRIQIEDMKSQLDIIQSSNQATGQMFTEIETTHNEALNKIETLKGLNEHMLTELSVINDLVMGNSDVESPLNTQIDQIQERISELENRIADIGQQSSIVQSELGRLSEGMIRLSEQTTAINAELKESRNENSKIIEQLAKFPVMKETMDDILRGIQEMRLKINK